MNRLQAILCTSIFMVLSHVGNAALVSVDWDLDNVADGIATGTLAGANVTLTSTDGPGNGGIAANFTAGWSTGFGTDDVPGITSPGIIDEGASIDWPSGGPGFATIDFGGLVAINPILLFNFADSFVETLDFADAIILSLLDSNSPGSVVIAAGNVVTTNGLHSNTSNDGFALQLIGSFTSISMTTNTANSISDSLGFSVAIDDGNIVSAVPLPSAFVLFAFGLTGLLLGKKHKT